MTKLTKKAAKELFTNRNVYVNGKSREIQDKLFECGYDDKHGFEDEDNPFLTIDDEDIYSDNSMNWFIGSSFKEITAEEILSIEIEDGFKDGNFVYCKQGDGGEFIWIFKECLSDVKSHAYYAQLHVQSNRLNINDVNCIYSGDKLSICTSEQRQFLINKLAKVGKRWDDEKKYIEDLPAELKDSKDFNPFDKVLVRDSDGYEKWKCDLFSHKTEDCHLFRCIGNSWKFCIPYQGNEHLLGTSDNHTNE